MLGPMRTACNRLICVLQYAKMISYSGQSWLKGRFFLCEGGRLRVELKRSSLEDNIYTDNFLIFEHSNRELCEQSSQILIRMSSHFSWPDLLKFSNKEC